MASRTGRDEPAIAPVLAAAQAELAADLELIAGPAIGALASSWRAGRDRGAALGADRELAADLGAAALDANHDVSAIAMMVVLAADRELAADPGQAFAAAPAAAAALADRDAPAIEVVLAAA